MFAQPLRWLSADRRRTVLLAGSILAAIASPAYELTKTRSGVPPDVLGKVAVIVALFLLIWLCYRAAARFASLPEAIRRRPQLTLHAVFWLVIVMAWMTAPAGGLWHGVLAGLVLLMPLVIWRCGYMLLSAQRGRIKQTRFRDHLIYLFPVWHGSSTPYGKGLDYLSRFEAKTEADLARSQLAGVKLLILALLWMLALRFMDAAVYGTPDSWMARALGGYTLSVPHVDHIIRKPAATPLVMAWISLYSELFWQTLKQATNGHLIIGILRLFGFNVFRNTYKPLLSESLIVFWNRYYFYFKELLAEFFFFPVFSRWFKSRPQLRLFAAIMASAFLGNLYYHVIKSEKLLLLGDPVAIWNSYNSQAFYCLLLALGLFVSMLREQRRSGQSLDYGWMRRILRIAGVWTFFALIYVWHGSGHFLKQTEFFFSLFGLQMRLG